MKLNQLLKLTILMLIILSCSHNSDAITYNWDKVVDRTWAGENLLENPLFISLLKNMPKRNKDSLFFMYLAFNAVHTPMHAKKEDLEKYKKHARKELAAMTWSLDDNIGKIVDKLKNLQQLENTLIFFLSDNGGATSNQSDNGSLKGFKGNKYEGGHRVPFLVHWKGELN